MNNETANNIIEKAALSLVCITLGATGFWFVNARAESPAVTNNAAYGAVADMTHFWEVWETVQKKYPFDAEEPTTDKKIDYAIKGMVAAYGDPFIDYFNKAESSNFHQDIDGEFAGIGAELTMKNGLLTVIAPLKDSPAQKAGIKSGDIITEIDGEPVNNKSTDEAVSIIRGQEGTVVVLSVAREGSPDILDISITREKVTLPSIESYTTKNGVVIVRLYGFDARTIKNFLEATKPLLVSKNPRLVIDLRGNPGGYLDVAVKLSSLFIPSGEVIVEEKPGTDGTSVLVHRSFGFADLPAATKLAVVVDRGSASASEIMAGALQDHGRAKLFGEKTFGKGSVQEVIDFSNGTALKVTVAKWYTPKGTSISKNGLQADVEIADDPKTKADEVIEAAIASLK